MIQKSTSAMRTLFFLVALLVCFFAGWAQNTTSFQLSQRIPIFRDGQNLALAWSGGTNAPQVSKIDLNGDGIEDLFIFDRTQGKVSTFVASAGNWAYAPEYETLFPQMSGWALLRDFDQDGDKDLFTSTTFGIRLFANEAEAGQRPRFVSFADPLQTLGRSGDLINLRIDLTDIAHFGDVDGDGDLDILNFAPSVGGSIEYHQNFSVERYGTPDRLELEKVDFQWGDIAECNCEVYGFNGNACRMEEAEHAGSTILAFDPDQDGDADLLIGDVGCTNLSFLENKGTPTAAAFDEFLARYPEIQPVDMQIFPAPFLEDVTFDGIADLLVAPNVFFNEDERVNFQESLWLYENTGTNQRPNFVFRKRNFLQENMLDLGENAHPAFYDEDQDGDLDLFIAYKGLPQSEGLQGGIAYFENTGSDQSPEFVYREERCTEWGCEGLSYTKISASEQGIVFWGYQAQTRQTPGWLLSRGSSTPQPLEGIPLNARDGLTLTDWNQDEHPDLLLARRDGRLDLYLGDENANFRLEKTQLGGLSDADNRELPRLAVGDLNEDGRMDIVRGDQTGALEVYLDVRNQPEDNWRAETIQVFSSISGQEEERLWGTLPVPALYDSDLMVGSGAGGLYFLQNRQLTSGTTAQTADKWLHLYPNPAETFVNIRTTLEAELSVFSLSGQLIKEKTALPAGKTVFLDTSAWASGVYLLRVESAQGVQTYRLVR